jgi:hypothetical protein
MTTTQNGILRTLPSVPEIITSNFSCKVFEYISGALTAICLGLIAFAKSDFSQFSIKN